MVVGKDQRGVVPPVVVPPIVPPIVPVGEPAVPPIGVVVEPVVPPVASGVDIVPVPSVVGTVGPVVRVPVLGNVVLDGLPARRPLRFERVEVVVRGEVVDWLIGSLAPVAPPGWPAIVPDRPDIDPPVVLDPVV